MYTVCIIIRYSLNNKRIAEGGNTPLHMAAMCGMSECFYCLFQHGANHTLLNERGESPHDVAKRHGKSKVISLACELICEPTASTCATAWLLHVYL